MLSEFEILMGRVLAAFAYFEGEGVGHDRNSGASAKGHISSCQCCKVQTFRPEGIVGMAEQKKHQDNCPVPAFLEYMNEQEQVSAMSAESGAEG